MTHDDAVQQVIIDLLEEHALALGGAAALHGISDDAVSDLVACLDSTGQRALARLAPNGLGGRIAASHPRLAPHPALVSYLARLRERAPAGR